MTSHGEMEMRGLGAPKSRYYASGRFGRLFPTLPEFLPPSAEVRKQLSRLGDAGGIMDAKDRPRVENRDNPDNPDIPAGFTFLGQFIDHDITFDPTSSLEREVDPEAIANFRTPLLELDSVYGAGPHADPYLYDRASRRMKFLIDVHHPRDLPRNSQMTALIGDPRNDENLIVSQLHLVFLKFHNCIVDRFPVADQERAPDRVFQEAQRLVRWHYQWIILHEFLPHIVGKDLMNEILGGGVDHYHLKNSLRFYDWRNEPFIPVEFAVAAYRFGHSQVRPGYRVNATFTAPLFDADQDPLNPDPNDLSGGKRAPRRFVEWNNFFTLNGNAPQNSKRIDTKLSSPLFQLPFSPRDLPAALAQRNLQRHLTFGLPSGQAVAKAMGIEPLVDELKDLAEFGMDTATPLWFYILREADLCADGKHLGQVGGRIVAEVLIGLLLGDRQSFIRADPCWRPTLGIKGEFGMADLIKVAGLA